jgi:hypothetical protein
MIPARALASFTRLWFECSWDSLRTGRRVLSGSTSGRELYALRSRCLARMSELADDQMRSGEFLELLSLTVNTLSASPRWRVTPTAWIPRPGRTRFQVAPGKVPR